MHVTLKIPPTHTNTQTWITFLTYWTELTGISQCSWVELHTFYWSSRSGATGGDRFSQDTDGNYCIDPSGMKGTTFALGHISDSDDTCWSGNPRTPGGKPCESRSLHWRAVSLYDWNSDFRPSRNLVRMVDFCLKWGEEINTFIINKIKI